MVIKDMTTAESPISKTAVNDGNTSVSHAITYVTISTKLNMQ